MSYFDFDEEATVSWADKPLLGVVENGPGNVRRFETLREALTFVSGELPEEARWRVFVMTPAKTYSGEEIDELLATLAAQDSR